METWRILMLLTMATMVVGEDKAKDKEECTNQLIGMATCLPYVQGQAKTPTPDCCTGLKQVLNSDKKCLCVIIQDRNDPDLGLQINVTLALSLPSVCHAPADVTKCPALLHLDPNSPEAQVFHQLGKGLNKTTASGPSGSAPGPISMSPTAGSDEGNTSGRSSSLQGGSHAYSFRKQWLISHVFVVLCIIFLI